MYKPFYDQLLEKYALSFLGRPYQWGGDDPLGGFDCSGLVIELMQASGEIRPGSDMTAQGLYNWFSTENAEEIGFCAFGALVFYGHSRHRITHVAFGLDKYRVLEAGSGGKSIRTMDDAIKHNAVIRIRPYNYRSDSVAIYRPFYKGIGARSV